MRAAAYIQGLDIDPLIVDECGAMAVDARFVIGRPQPSRQRYALMAIHPDPQQLVSHYLPSDGTHLTIRPVWPEDARIEDDFAHGLSPQSNYFRFMRGINDPTRDILIRLRSARLSPRARADRRT